MNGRIVQLSISPGGVPKLPIPEAEVTPEGLVGDAHRMVKIHGGPERAVCLYSAEVLAALVAEGHAAEPGAVGENVTVEGLPWQQVVPGARLALGEQVVVEVTRYASPCRTISHVFRDGVSERISQETHPGESRVYARVLANGRIRTGDAVRILPSPASGRGSG
jgi:MOSC domain-containing protein YiiM